jgi:ubiquinone/menaquinone biosynthesis C-methylase UbiE
MIAQKNSLKLLPPEALLKTGEVDHADWNFRPLLGAISRTRYRLVLSLLGEGKSYERILEVGYGSGVFMPELAARSEELYGIDIHSNEREVAEKLAKFNVHARLFSASAADMPFESGVFDCIVAVSALEFIEELERACLELKRVLKPDGFLVAVTPGHSAVTDLGLKLLTGKSARKDYDNRRELLMPTLLKHFEVIERKTAPPFVGSLLRLYTALKLHAKT